MLPSQVIYATEKQLKSTYKYLNIYLNNNSTNKLTSQNASGILGEMKELGSYSALYHTEILDAAKFCDFIILYGDIWQKEPIDLKDSELYNKIIISKSLEDCYYKIVEYIKNENIILIKGSHGNRLDIIVSKIIKEFM